MLNFARIITLLCLFPHVKADECAPEKIDWSPGEVSNKPIDECDLLGDEVTIHFDRLTERHNCLRQVFVKITIPNKPIYDEQFLSPNTDTGFYQRTLSFSNFLSFVDRCSTVSVRIKTKVLSEGQIKDYETNFLLNPEGCTESNDGVDFKEKCSAFVDVDSIQSTTDKDESTDKNHSSDDQEQNDNKTTFFLLVGGSGVLLLLLLALLVICLVKNKRRRDFRRKAKVDINDTYGTYDITGEMSDYTTVEDTNDYYGQ